MEWRGESGSGVRERGERPGELSFPSSVGVADVTERKGLSARASPATLGLNWGGILLGLGEGSVTVGTSSSSS